MNNTRGLLASERLLDQLYFAPYEASGWHGFLKEMVRQSGSRSARLLVMNQQADQVYSGVQVNTDDKAHKAFVDHFVNLCPWRPGLAHLPPGKFYSSYLDGICDQKTFYRSEFFNDWAKELDIHHGASGTVWQFEGQTIQMFFQRTGGQGHFRRYETDAFNALAPHIRRALRLEAIIHQQKQKQGYLEHTGRFSAFILLDANQRAVHVSEAAWRHIQDNPHALRLGKRVSLQNGEAQQRLDFLLRASFAGGAAGAPVTGGVIALPRPARAPLLLQVVPLHPDADRPLMPVPAHAALYLVDGDAEPEFDTEKLANLLGLTQAEAEVAAFVAGGQTAAKIASFRRVSLHTVRSQIKSIFSKTDVSSQAQLTRLVKALPATRDRQRRSRTPFLS